MKSFFKSKPSAWKFPCTNFLLERTEHFWIFIKSRDFAGIAIKKGRDRFTVATKVGLVYEYGKGSMGTGGVCGTPEYIGKEIESSLKRLETDHIDL